MLNRQNEKQIYSLGFCGDNDNQEDYIDMLMGALDSCDTTSDEYENAAEELDDNYPHRYYVRGDNYRGWIAYDLYSMNSTDGFEDAQSAKEYIREWYAD